MNATTRGLSILTLIALGTAGVSLAGSPPQAPNLSLRLRGDGGLHLAWQPIGAATEYRLLEDPDSHSGYTAVATVAAGRTSHDLKVFLPERINARYILQACNSAGCTDSAAVYVAANLIELLAQQAYVKASNTGAGDWFGNSVALAADGNTLAVEAANEASSATGLNGNQADNSALSSGAV